MPTGAGSSTATSLPDSSAAVLLFDQSLCLSLTLRCDTEQAQHRRAPA